MWDEPDIIPLYTMEWSYRMKGNLNKILSELRRQGQFLRDLHV